MAKLVDALDLGSSGVTHKSAPLFTRTKNQIFVCKIVIPAFRALSSLVIPAQAGMKCPAGIKNKKTRNLIIRLNKYPVEHVIPAFAGMTKELKFQGI